MAESSFLGTGRRKTSLARVILSKGEGNLVINGKPSEDYFKGHDSLAKVVKGPLVLTETGNQYDILVSASGGGKSSQAGAVSLGIARALIQVNPELRPVLSKAGLLRRDPRMVERKKYGQPGARKRFQFSKR